MRTTLIRSMRQTPLMNMRPTQMLREMPKQEQSAHTISQRLRMIRKMPTELIPLAVVVGVAGIAAVYSMGKKLMGDSTLRLKRQHRDH